MTVKSDFDCGRFLIMDKKKLAELANRRNKTIKLSPEHFGSGAFAEDHPLVKAEFVIHEAAHMITLGHKPSNTSKVSEFVSDLTAELSIENEIVASVTTAFVLKKLTSSRNFNRICLAVKAAMVKNVSRHREEEAKKRFDDYVQCVKDETFQGAKILRWVEKTYDWFVTGK